MTKKLFIQTYGCQMNDYDSDRMADLLTESHGMTLTDNPEEAEVVLINTCSIREKAQEKLFHQLGRFKKLKEKRADLVIGVGGCVASQEGERIVKRAPQVDLVFGPQTLHHLPAMLDRHRKDKIRLLDTSFPTIEKFDHLPAPSVKGPIANVSIMEGCSKFCSFCVVPYTRGKEVSRPLDDVLKELTHLARAGVREVNLLGQNVNSYLGRIDRRAEVDLAELIEYVAAISGIDRIRFTTSHPLEFKDRLVAAFACVPELPSHVHLPVQSGSNTILERMKRGYTKEYYLNIIDKLKAARPGISLSSDFIVGFPNETDADFEDTMSLVRAVQFDVSFSFIYSPRPGTPAAELDDAIPMTLKKQRLYALQALLSEQARAVSEAMVGTEQSVLVTGISKRDQAALQGRTENNRVVNFKAPASVDGVVADAATSTEPDGYAKKHPLIGQFVRVKVKAAMPNSLRGEMLVGASTRAVRSVGD